MIHRLPFDPLHLPVLHVGTGGRAGARRVKVATMLHPLREIRQGIVISAVGVVVLSGVSVRVVVAVGVVSQVVSQTQLRMPSTGHLVMEKFGKEPFIHFKIWVIDKALKIKG